MKSHLPAAKLKRDGRACTFNDSASRRSNPGGIMTCYRPAALTHPTAERRSHLTREESALVSVDTTNIKTTSQPAAAPAQGRTKRFNQLPPGLP